MKKRKTLVVGSLKLRWHEHNEEWTRSIGYGWNRDESALVQRDHYFGGDDAAAITSAAEKIVEWRGIKANWSTIAPSIRHLYIGKDLSRPFWLEKRIAPSIEQREVAVVTPIADHTVRTSRDLYKKEREDRIGLRNAQGLKRMTVNTDISCLDEVIKPMDPALPIASITYNVLKGLVHHQYSRGIGERTALNYCRGGLKKWVDWMADHPNFTWSKPKGTDSLFKLGTVNPDPYIPTDDEVKEIYKVASNPMKMYILFGINCGATQKDIAELQPAELVTFRGETYLWWAREKTSHQNSFKTLHWLFPELVELIKKCRAKANEFGTLFLSPANGKLHVEFEGTRSTPIYNAFLVAKKAAKIETDLDFKSFRKYGGDGIKDVPASALDGSIDSHLISRMAGDNLARFYLGQKLPAPLNSYIKYKQKDFNALTAGLKAFHARLKTAEII